MPENKIIIENVKGIRKMEFNLPSSGVHVITASNGSGKTTLMTCILRLKQTQAFNDSFLQSKSTNVDSYKDSKITYTSRSGTSVSYTYRKVSDSWRPLTKTTKALQEFGYTNIVFMPTLGKRIYIQNQVIRGGQVRAASDELREAMSSVLENPKFRELRKINIGETRGRIGRERREVTAFILLKGFQTIRNSRIRTYYSESSFSLGEIFTLNLLYELITIPNNSLLVIDELEVALHPKVQVNLLNYINTKAIEKNLTVIVSTHSSSIIKCASNLIFLDNDRNGNITVHYNCYPALALQEVSVEEDMQPDFVFFVEDESAASLLREMILIYLTINPTRHKPLWKILPIGGYTEVLRFTRNANNYLINRRIGQYAFLDGDVQQTKTQLQQKGNHRTNAENELWQLFQELNDRTKYLNITPELGVWEWITNHTNNANNIINLRFPDANINLNNLINSCNLNYPNPANNPRDDAKRRLSWMCNEINSQTNEDRKRIKQHLFASYCEGYFSIQINKNSLNQLFGPIFKHIIA